MQFPFHCFSALILVDFPFYTQFVLLFRTNKTFTVCFLFLWKCFASIRKIIRQFVHVPQQREKLQTKIDKYIFSVQLSFKKIQTGHASRKNRAARFMEGSCQR